LVGLKLNVKEKNMTLREHQKQIDKLQKRLAEVVDELRITQSDIKQFKSAVANDIKRLVEVVKK
jgi:H2-forming N5,N10-methylenetetrahydromethanopterin dehydrogenase-like enzyme